MKIFSMTRGKIGTITTLADHNHVWMYYMPLQFLSYHSSCKHVFSIRVENDVDPDQLRSQLI